jgi:hypothetical protein
MFNEDTLREEIVKVWGEHGAHIEVFDHILAMAKEHLECERSKDADHNSEV